MTMHNPFAGETPFPPAGEGVVLKFTTSDMARLHSLYGPDVRKPPEVDEMGRPVQTFWTTLLGHLSLHDPVVIGNLLRTGLKEPNGSGKMKPIRRDEDFWEDPPFSYETAAGVIEAALHWSRWGITPEEHAKLLRAQVEENERAAQEGAVEPDPTMTTGEESPTSSDLSSAPTSTE